MYKEMIGLGDSLELGLEGTRKGTDYFKVLTTIAFMECLSRAHPCAKRFTCIISFNPYGSLNRWTL